MITFEKTEQRIWHGCYGEGWGELLTPESMSHPAKYSLSLIKRILEYMLERGYIQPGQTILDPFGGVGNGGIATWYGLNYVGMELEQRFADMASGCQCTGLSAQDYRRFYSRFRPEARHRIAYEGNFSQRHKGAEAAQPRHWCPACLAALGKVEEASALSLSYASKKRRARIADLQKRLGKRLGRAVVLVDPLPFPEKYRPQAVTRSLFDEQPESGPVYRRNSGRIPVVQPHTYEGNLSRFKKYAQPGTAAVLLQGDSRRLRQRLAEVMGGLVSSPPYAGTEVNPGNVGNAIKRETWGKGVKLSVGANGYGIDSGQLGNLKEGSLADSIVTSPPFAGNTGGRGEASRQGINSALFDRHSGGMKRGTGENPDNLDHLPMAGFDAALASPPFADSVGSDDPQKRGGLLRSDPRRAGDRNLTGSYGLTEGQLGAMNGGFDGAVTSPPFEEQRQYTEDRRSAKFKADSTFKAGLSTFTDYGKTDGQLGTEQGATFWSAARLIVSESYLALKPGAYGAWVLKAFIRDGKRVDFPGQWTQLCEACGFEFVEEVRAMLVTDNGVQMALEGKGKRLKKESKSFFRRLFESRLDEDQDDLRIDWETVIIMRKPAPKEVTVQC